MERFEEATPVGELGGNPSGVSGEDGGTDLLERFVAVCPVEWRARLGPNNRVFIPPNRDVEPRQMVLLPTNDDLSARALILLLDHLEELGYRPVLDRRMFGTAEMYCCRLPYKTANGWLHLTDCVGKTRISAVVRAFVTAANKALESATPPSEKSEAKPHPE